jgi:hypothetical protein
MISSRRMRWLDVKHARGDEKCTKILVDKHERKRPLGRPSHPGENKTKIHFNEIECDDVDWIAVFQDRVSGVLSCEHDNEPSDSIKGREFLQKLSDYQLLNKDSSLRS